MSRDSDTVPPPWQSDEEVSECPVCHGAFGWLIRKHHCRKCGKVVCAACSPHRITIPRPYIVRSPLIGFSQEDLARLESYNEREFGGGEVVRVCKPCVPDPWTPTASNSLPERQPEISPVPPRPQQPPATPPDAGFYRTTPQSGMPVPTYGRTYSGVPLDPSNVPPPWLGDTPAFGRRGSGQPSRRSPGFDEFIRSATSRSDHRRQTNHEHPPPPPGLPSFSPSPLQPPPGSPLHFARRSPSCYRPALPTRRREIKEEDECPVCGNELPPGEAAREAHIAQCVQDRFACASGTSVPSSSPAPSNNNSIGGVSASTPPKPVPRPRATSYKPRGMAVYHATEKDCTNEDGETQECVICMEDFQEGDELGRMECLCKFHKRCIRSWWITKRIGSCPTHQLHD